MGALDIEGCFTHCRTHCAQNGCDYVCPSKLDDFIVSFFEVGGFDDVCDYPVTGPIVERLPIYIPNILHGSGRIVPFDRKVLAVPLYKFVHHQGKQYGSFVRTAEELRSLFQIDAKAEIIVISSGPDQNLENFWEHFEAERVVDALLPLGISGITIPNFSYFLDAPRTEILYNFRRMMIVMEAFARAGLPTIPHINAITPQDWDDWFSFLKDQPAISCVAMEFQTGLRQPSRGRPMLEQLKKLQDRLGRSIHPLLIGGGGYAQDARQALGKYSLVDAMPFMKSFKRHRLKQNGSASSGWEQAPTEIGAPIDHLLAYNVLEYEVRLLRKMGVGFDIDRRQMLLAISPSNIPANRRSVSKLRSHNGLVAGRGQDLSAWPDIPTLKLTAQPVILGSNSIN